ncbi:MAG: DUF2298 domain-containing protein [Bdellovibrionota bacterium]|nr:MAG: DUF2298 domain-containing protein [Bdellovibrionota bacterium]
MIVLIVLLALGGLAWWRRSDPYLLAVGTLLLTPLVALPLGVIGIGPRPLVYAGIMLLLAWILARSGLSRDEVPSMRFEFLALLVSFAFFLGLSSLWPDFISIGERLRDYAILSSVIDLPYQAREPWLSGSTLNYYLYWYRFGAMWASLGALDAAATYHVLVSLTFALFYSALMGCARVLLGLAPISAAFIAGIIALGSNFEGIRHFLTRDGNWWGPSRIIDGGYAISEFPAWSFLLGDAHPHYLNLALIPLFVLVVSTVAGRYRLSLPSAAAMVPPWFIATSLWVYGANAWELPAWCAVGALICFGWGLRSWWQAESTLPQLRLTTCAVSSAIAFLIVLLLWPAVSNITPADAPLTLVADPVRPSLTFEFLRHWGVPFALLTLILPLHLKRVLSRIAAYTASVLFVLLPMPGYLIGLLLVCAVAAFLYELHTPSDDRLWIVHALGVAGLTLVLFPEICFINDPYGGETERMNTIFKFYSTAWFMLNLYACALLVPYLRIVHEKSPVALLASSVVVASLLCGFFFRTVQIRKITGEPLEDTARGLRSVEREFPGASSAIQFLDRFPRTVVLEAQGKPYSYTSFVATLSNHDSYLGWANHVNLLTRELEKIANRETVTRTFYESSDCDEKRRLLRREGIAFVVVGELERRTYPQLRTEDFSCLTKSFEQGKYAIFTP